MNYNHVNKELFSFLDRSPNAFYAVKNMCDVLSEAGMTRLYEGASWELEAGRGYFVSPEMIQRSSLSGSRRRTTPDSR